MRTKLILLLLVCLILAGCGGDQAAIDRAKADRIRQEAADEAAARAAAELRKAADWEKSQNAALFTKSAVGVILALALLFFAGVVLFLFWNLSRATGDAWQSYSGKRAEIAAGTIKVDRETRTLPALLTGGAVHNLDTGQVYRLGEPQLPDPQLVAANAHVRGLGLAARAAERIGESTRDGRAADALPGVTSAMPVLMIEEGKTVDL